MRINKTIGNAVIQFDSARIDGNLREAQKELNKQIVADCDPYIPFSQGALKGSVRFPEGIYGGLIEWDTPYAHYQYKGELYLTKDGRSYAEKYERKFPTGKPLTQHYPGSTDHWFEEAKAKHKEEWLDLVKRIAGRD